MKSMFVIALATVIFSWTYAFNWKECLDFGCFKSQDALNNDLPRDACGLSPIVFTNAKVNLTRTNCGGKFKREDLTQVPTRVQWSEAKKKSLYTLLFIEHFFVDTQELYWGVSNINGTDLKKGADISRDYTTLHEYVGPYNLLRTSQVLIYEQTRRIPSDISLRHNPAPGHRENADQPNDVPIPTTSRINLDTWNFAWEQHLRGPHAGLQIVFSD